MSKKPIVKVGIYLRKSRSEEGIQDLAKHKNYLVEICTRNKWSYELYEEIDSSQDIMREELQRLRHDIELGKIDAVMVHAVDRLSRRSRHFLEIIEDYFIDQGMTRLFVKDTENDLHDPTTITMLQLQATLSQAEYSFIVKRLNEGRISSLKNGIITGKLIYGYYFDKEEKKVKLHPEESKVVRKICDWLLEGETYLSICDRLNALQYRTRKGNLWDIHNIKSIAHSPIIRGHVIQHWKDEEIIVRDSHEAIISESEYAKIKEILDTRSINFKNLKTAPTHYLQGLMKCPKCGKVMTIQANKPKKKVDGKWVYTGDNVYYVRACRHQLTKQSCGNLGCVAGEIENTVRLIIKEYSQELNQKIKELMKTDSTKIKTSMKETVSELKKAIEKIETKEEGLLDLLVDKTIDKETYNKRINKLKDEKAVLYKELQKSEEELNGVNVEQEVKFQEQLLDALQHWDSLNGDQKRKALQLTFKEFKYEHYTKEQPPLVTAIPV